MFMDLITDLPRSEGFDSILTIIDQGCLKAAKFIPCNKMIDGPGIAQEYLKHLVPWFRVPKCIILDQDPHFTSNYSKAICKALGVQHNSWKNDTTWHSPHKLLTETRPQVNVQLIDGNTPAANVRLKELEEARQEVQRNLEARQS